MKILLVGVSTRFIAQSAVNAGYEVTSLDYFGDSDQPETAKVVSLTRDLHLEPSPTSLASAIPELLPGMDAVVFGAGVENELKLIEACGTVPVIGNSAETIWKVRDLKWVSEQLNENDVIVPKIKTPGDRLPKTGRWLLKDLTRSGGMGISDWDGVSPLDEGCILQQFADGQLCSVTFLADGNSARILGMARQYAGLSELHAERYGWCGNAAPLIYPELEDRLLTAINIITAKAGLKGINGIDFILNEGKIHLLEINPRFPASAELIGKLLKINVFQAHLDACQGKILEFSSLSAWNTALAMAIFYAPRDLVMGAIDHWASIDRSDIPHFNETIQKGSPVCSLHAGGNDLADAWQNAMRQTSILEKELIG